MQIEKIPRQEAIDFLIRRKHPRGPGASVDLINYGLRNDKGKLVAVARISPTPYGNAPARAAVGEALASHVVYLMRQSAAGISADELVEFVRCYVTRIRTDFPNRDYRYLLSIDDPQANLIVDSWGLCISNKAVTGRVYVRAGCLDAGTTRSRRQCSRWIDPDTKRIRSIYSSGRNLSKELRGRKVRYIEEGVKHRFLFVLADRHSLEYAAWRMALPSWVTEPEWGERELGWVQPRLLANLRLIFSKLAI